jgi:hypothetical protein
VLLRTPRDLTSPLSHGRRHRVGPDRRRGPRAGVQGGRELDEWRAQGIERWAAIERPDGRVVDFLLDHGVVVYPVNPKALNRTRDRVRQSGAKSDPFDARVLADFLRTDHLHLQALPPSSEAAQELKLLTEDCQRHIRQQTRLVNQLTTTLKAYYPRALEVAELTTALAREFLHAYPTPEALTVLTARQWQRWARGRRLSEARIGALWAVLQPPQLPVRLGFTFRAGYRQRACYQGPTGWSRFVA